MLINHYLLHLVGLAFICFPVSMFTMILLYLYRANTKNARAHSHLDSYIFQAKGIYGEVL